MLERFREFIIKNIGVFWFKINLLIFVITSGCIQASRVYELGGVVFFIRCLVLPFIRIIKQGS